MSCGKKHKYANGGQVKVHFADGGPVKKAKKGGKKKQPKPEMLGSGMAANAGTALRDTRKKQMEGMGLADGGKVKMKPPEKGGKPKQITTPGKPGDTGPLGATPARDRKKKK